MLFREAIDRSKELHSGTSETQKVVSSGSSEIPTCSKESSVWNRSLGKIASSPFVPSTGSRRWQEPSCRLPPFSCALRGRACSSLWLLWTHYATSAQASKAARLRWLQRPRIFGNPISTTRSWIGSVAQPNPRTAPGLAAARRGLRHPAGPGWPLRRIFLTRNAYSCGRRLPVHCHRILDASGAMTRNFGSPNHFAPHFRSMTPSGSRAMQSTLSFWGQ